MENEQIIDDRDKKNRSSLSKVIIFIVSMGIILGVYVLIGNYMTQVGNKRYELKEYEYKDFIRYVESAEVIEGELVISGWCFYKGVDTEQNKVQVFLRNVEDEADTIWLDVESVIRKDVDDYYDCDVDYSGSGFRAKKELKKISLEGKNYEILIKLTYFVDEVVQKGDEEKVTQEHYVKTVLTNQYLCDGVLTELLPKDEPIQTESTLLNEILRKGQLMLYHKEADIYVYQYGTKMYWVAGKNFCFEENGATYIQFQFGTTRVDRLPQKRQEKGYDYDNIGFVFEECELKDEATEPYRVAVRNIPSEYPITCFWTGYYANSEWVWLAYRTPDISKLGN